MTDPSRTPIVIGIDTDSNGFHWVSSHPLWDGTGDYTEPTPFGFALLGSKDVESRRIATYAMAKSFFKSLPPNKDVHIFCEESLSLKNGKTNRVLAMAAGAVWCAHVEASLYLSSKRQREITHPLTATWWHWVDVASWKKAVCGKGNVNKEQIRTFCTYSHEWRREADERWGQEDEGGGITLRDTSEINNNLFDAWCICEYGKLQIPAIMRQMEDL